MPPLGFYSIRNFKDGFQFTKEKLAAVALILQDKYPSTKQLDALVPSKKIQEYSKDNIEKNRFRVDYNNEVNISAVSEGRVARALIELLETGKLKYVVSTNSWGHLDTKFQSDFIAITNDNKIVPIQVKASQKKAERTSAELDSHVIVSDQGYNIFSEPRLSQHLNEQIKESKGLDENISVMYFIEKQASGNGYISGLTDDKEKVLLDKLRTN